MPSSIPYDPSLTLGNIVTEDALDVVTSISKAQAPVDAAHEELNALIMSKRSLGKQILISIFDPVTIYAGLDQCH